MPPPEHRLGDRRARSRGSGVRLQGTVALSGPEGCPASRLEHGRGPARVREDRAGEKPARCLSGASSRGRPARPQRTRKRVGRAQLEASGTPLPPAARAARRGGWVGRPSRRSSLVSRPLATPSPKRRGPALSDRPSVMVSRPPSAASFGQTPANWTPSKTRVGVFMEE